MAILSRPYGSWKKKKRAVGKAAEIREEALGRQVSRVVMDWETLKAEDRDRERVGKKEITEYQKS